MSATRRDFLKTAAAASAAVAAPRIATAKRGEAEPIVGSGEHTYRCVHDWGRDALPDGHGYGNASHGVAIDRDGFVYIAHQGGPESVFVFDPDGRFVRSLATLHSATNKKTGQTRSTGHGIDIREENGESVLYLAPTNAAVGFTKMTTAGEVIWTRGREQIAEESDALAAGTKFRPTNTSFRPDGGYYLGDGYGSDIVFEYDADDRFVRAIGGTGTEDGRFRTPHGQWLDDRDGTPKLVVADRANKRLQWFAMDGSHLRTQDGFLFPADIDVRGDLMLVPDLHARITILDADNRPVAQLGDDEPWRTQVLGDDFAMRRQPQRWRPGRFVHPHDACFDADGDIYVTEWVVGGRVTKLERVSG